MTIFSALFVLSPLNVVLESNVLKIIIYLFIGTFKWMLKILQKKKYFIMNIFYVSTKFVIVIQYTVISFN